MNTRVIYQLDGYGGVVKTERPLTQAEIDEIAAEESRRPVPQATPTLQEYIAALEARVAALEDGK